MSPDIESGIQTYAIALDALMCAYTRMVYTHVGHTPVVIELKQKFARVVLCNESAPEQLRGAVVSSPCKYASRSYAWIDLATGDVLKGTWKAVDRKVMHIKRGNVVDGSWLDWHGPHGLGYADRHGEFRRMLPNDDYMVACDAIKGGDAKGAAALLARAITEVSSSSTEGSHEAV